MIKRTLALALALIMVLGLLPMGIFAAYEDYPSPDLGPQAQGAAADRFARGEVISVAHRAAWRHGPENSLLAIAAAINMGVDAVELDVALTKDKVLVLSHDATVKRCVVGETGNVSDYTWEELSKMQLEPRTGGTDKAYILTESDAQILNSLSDYASHSGGPAKAGGTLPLTRLDDAIELIDRRAMINLDKCTSEEVFVASYILFREAGMLDHVLFKNSVRASTLLSWCESAADAWNEKHPEETLTGEDVQGSFIYVYVLSSSGTSVMQGHLDAGNPLKMVEIVISNNALEQKIKETDEVWCRQNGIKMFINTMWSGLASTRPDSETCWAEMIDRGYTAIQTDRPSELAEYLDATLRTERASAQTVEAEHFSTFSYGMDFGLSVPAEADAELNKTVNGIQNGEWLAYDNIVFDGSETFVSVLGHGLAENARLSVCLDGITADESIAEISLELGEDATYTAALEKPVNPGKHTVYIKASGTLRTDLATLDSFSFGGGLSLAGEPDIPPVVVSTEPGVAPALPEKVNVSYDNAAYDFAVQWDGIPAADYAEEGYFTVLGYVGAIKEYVTATVIVRTVDGAVSEEGLALWLEGADIPEGKITSWPAKDGFGNDATVRAGSFTLKDVGSGKGVYFNGSSAFDIVMDDGFWNGKSEYTVIIYNSPEMTTKGSNSITACQYNSALHFGESGNLASAYFTPSRNEIIWHFGSSANGNYGTTYLRPISIGSLYSGTAIRKSGAEDAVFVDGVQVYGGRSDSALTAGIGSDGYIGVGKNGNYYQGTICEILIYDRALTDDEIAAAHKYLAEKYSETLVSYGDVEINCNAGEAPVLPDTVKATFESGMTVDLGVKWDSVDPRLYVSDNTFEVGGRLANGDAVVAKVTVTGQEEKNFSDLSKDMLVWFSATGLEGENNAPVSRWTQSVGDGAESAVQTNIDDQPSLVVNDDGTVAGVYFDGSDKMTFSMLDKDLLNGLSGATAIVYSKPEKTAPTAVSSNHNSSVVYFGEGGDGWGGVYLGTYTDGAAGRFGTGTADYRGVLYRGGSYSDYTTTVMTKNGGEHEELTVNGVKVSNPSVAAGSGAGATANNDASKGILGQGKNNTYWQGTVSEVMIFDRALTEEELQLVYDYLDATYNTEKEASVSEDGLLVWLDGSDGLTGADGKVTGWTNKVNGSQIATVKGSAAPALLANAINGKGGVEFDGSTALTLTLDDGALNGLEGATVIAYTYTLTPFMTGEETSQGTSWRSQRRTLLYAGEKGGGWGSVFMGVYTDALSARIGTGTNNDNGVYYSRAVGTSGFGSTAVIWNGTNKTYSLAVDGQTVGSGASLGTVSKHNNNVLYIGEGKEPDTYGGWKGTLTELLIYDRALTDSEIRAVNNYLEEKYTPEKAPELVTGVYLKEEGARSELLVGDGLTLSACAVPANADNPDLIWESSDPDIVSVDKDGKLTANSLGFAVITVTTDEGDFSANCSVQVVKTESERLWDDIQNVVAWAQSADEARYDGLDALEEAISALNGLSAESTAEALGDAYAALSEGMKTLTLKGHTHTYGDSYVITDASYAQAGLEVLVCTECHKAQGREIPALDSIDLPFTDVPEGKWYYEAVEFAYGNKLFNGVSDTLFAPDLAMNRAMLVSVLYRMEGNPASSGENPFTDVEEGRYYFKAVLWASSNGIVRGTSADKFSPDVDITREQMATILYRYSQVKGYDTDKSADLSAFPDGGDTSAYAKNALAWAHAEGLINGVKAGEQNLLMPGGSATRAQVATILMRYLSTVAK